MSSSCPSSHVRFSVEYRPKLLKDFLQDDSPSYPQKAYIKSAISQGVSSKIKLSQLLRSCSSRAASANISAIHKIMNIVKSFPFASIKSPSILPRSISRKLSRTRCNYKENDNYIMNHEVTDTIKVKVKDILRWKSSRYLVQEKSTSFDYIATATTSTASSSQRSSWCDSDFTAEDLHCYSGEINIEECVGGSCFMGETRGIKLDPKEHICLDEIEQQSPVSVLESPFREDHRKKCVLMQRIIQEFEKLAKENTSFKAENYEKEEQEQEMYVIIEQKAKKILSQLKETRNLCMKDCEANLNDQLLFDFFLHELIQNNVDESEMLMREAKSWINGEYNGEFEWEMEDKREAYIRDMQRVGRWNNFEEEKEELTSVLEFELFNNLVHEVLIDLFALNCLKN
ncbi:uncharacterized protein LOC129876904 [Solanum dulcamara]|uniref:uncharacterized protein LOC129876904 n=1 Tax=Solanum dulcamara TaxID=45834 RepID=UPI00248608C0|nr:uncharacterized protein LOC129876904 [Solanum dulcamara]